MYSKDAFLWLGERRKNVYSQFGESGILEAIFERIGTTNRTCVECGAADGTFFSNTRHLIEQGWSSLQLEADGGLFEKLAALYWDRKDVRCWRERVDADKRTFDKLFAEARLPVDLDLLVIDVDGQDYWLFHSLLKYHPRVVMVEYDPGEHIDHVPKREGNEGPFKSQAGLEATIKLGIGKLYWPVAITTTNVIFVQQKLCGALVNPTAAVASNDPASRLPAAEFQQIGTKDLEFQSGDDFSPHVALVMSTPRVGFLSTMDCIARSVQQLNLSFFRGEGAFWSHTLSRAISRAIDAKASYIVTADYDTVFECEPTNNAVAKLVCLLHDNPGVDVIVAGQMKREAGSLLATTETEVRLLAPLIPITQGHFGLTIFRASVFERLRKPWFWEAPNENGDWEENRIDADIGFWKNCVECGINVQMALDVMIGHLEMLVTWPGQNLQPIYQPVNDWREKGKPVAAFDRQRVLAAVKANPALLYAPKLEMGG